MGSVAGGRGPRHHILPSSGGRDMRSTWSSWRGGLALAALVLSPAAAQEFDRAIMGGPTIGDYNQLARDIADLAGRCGIAMDVVESQGGLDNFLAVRKRPNTQLGISRSDVLEYMSTYAQDDPVVAEAVEGVRVVRPLHDEAVHLFGGVDIEGLEDLDGKRVAIGPAGSGTFITASLVLGLAGIEPAERVAIDFTQMIPALLGGEIDALFFVAPVPVDIRGGENIDTERFHLIPVEDPLLDQVYEPTEIPPGSYPFHTDPEPVGTVSAKTVLLTYEYEPQRNAYHRQSCRAVSDVAHLLATRIDELREVGHPQWSSVDLDEVQPGWEVSRCAQAGMSPDHTLSCDAMPTEIVEDPTEAYRRRICSVIGC